MRASEAWEGYVGDQTPAEFWRIAQEKGAVTYEEACQTYAEDLPQMMSDWVQSEQPPLSEIAGLLERYLEQTLGDLD